MGTLQSTSLLRGKTQSWRQQESQIESFNPLPSCEGRRACGGHAGAARSFNPLPSCEGRRSSRPLVCSLICFNPLPSCEGRQQISPKITHSYFIILYISTIQFLIILTADTNFGVICLLFLHFNGANPF